MSASPISNLYYRMKMVSVNTFKASSIYHTAFWLLLTPTPSHGTSRVRPTQPAVRHCEILSLSQFICSKQRRAGTFRDDLSPPKTAVFKTSNEFVSESVLQLSSTQLYSLLLVTPCHSHHQNSWCQWAQIKCNSVTDSQHMGWCLHLVDASFLMGNWWTTWQPVIVFDGQLERHFPQAT